MNEFNNIKENNGFKVPDEYFNNFSNKMSEIIKQEETQTIKPFNYKPILTMAAVFISVLIVSWVIFTNINTTEQTNNSDILAYLEYNIDDISDDLLYESLEENSENLEFGTSVEIDYLEEIITEDELIENLKFE